MLSIKNLMRSFIKTSYILFKNMHLHNQIYIGHSSAIYILGELWDNTSSVGWRKNYRESPHFVISQFVMPAISWFYFGPYFLILKKKIQKKNFFRDFFFFQKIFLEFFCYLYFFFVDCDCHLMNIKISLLTWQLQEIH